MMEESKKNTGIYRAEIPSRQIELPLEIETRFNGSISARSLAMAEEKKVGWPE